MSQKLTAKFLEDIVLGEPITSRGKASLKNIGFERSITIKDFYENEKMYIVSKYDSSSPFYISQKSEDESWQYPYSVSSERFNENKENLENFNKKFTSDAEGESPLIITGPAGNGKSIEVNHKIIKLVEKKCSHPSNYIYYDLEESSSTYKKEITFNAPICNNTLWLFCISLLHKFYDCVKDNVNRLKDITNNYKEYFIDKYTVDDTEKKLFFCIEEYSDSAEKVKNLSSAMINLIDKNDAKQSIMNLLSVTMDLMYCIEPKNKNYIIFDIHSFD